MQSEAPQQSRISPCQDIFLKTVGCGRGIGQGGRNLRLLQYLYLVPLELLYRSLPHPP